MRPVAATGSTGFHQNIGTLLRTCALRCYREILRLYAIGDFDVAPDGTEIIFDRVQDSSSIALFERTR
jgi:hypothetical protein